MIKEESEKLKEFVDFYKQQHAKISRKESQIMDLTKECETILHDLIVKREEEKKYMDSLKAKYGEDELKKEFAILSGK